MYLGMHNTDEPLSSTHDSQYQSFEFTSEDIIIMYNPEPNIGYKNNAAIIRRLMRFIALLETPTQILQWGITERRARERGKYIIPT